MEARSTTFYVSVDPRFEAVLVPDADSSSFSENQRCFLTRLATDGAPDLLEAYISAMEVMGATEITSLVELGNRVPEVLISDLVYAASAECGALSYATAQMQTPEFVALIDDPVVAQGLMGQ